MSYLLEYIREGSGFYEVGEAGSALGDRKLVYLDANGVWQLADADAAATMPTLGITIGAISTGSTGKILTYGYIGLASWSWSEGGAIYASATAGELTQTAPNIGTQVSQVIGHAKDSDLIFIVPKLARGATNPTFTHSIHVGVGTVRVPGAAAPDVVVQDNAVLLSFNQNDTESAYLSWAIPTDYAGGDLTIMIHWTNDGGTDDNGKNVLWEINYQSMANGDVVSGSHANSPKTAADTYTSASGWIFHTTPMMTIAAADFAGDMQIEFRVTALAAAATQLTGESHLIAMMFTYLSYSDL